MHDDDGHPLLVELASLRQTAARFQHEAHAAAIKLQRHSLESLRLYEHAAALEQENTRLTHEIDILRAHPDVQHHPAVAQVQELSLALRRVSDKIKLTEDTLLHSTSDLTDARSDLVKARHASDGAYALAACLRAREEASKARERELEFKARASEEERKMVDLVVQEYADLVRNLERRRSANHTLPGQNGSASSITLVDSLQDGKSTLHRMLTAFSTESEQLHATIAELNAKISDLQIALDAERLTATHDRRLLSQTKTELDKLNLEDQTAAKMVARYMKFSQASTNALQEQITTLKTRHASMIKTFELQLSIVDTQLSSERTRSARLQDALDELCEDLARESYGRRREVALRLSLLSREEGIAEFLRRWARRARESYARCYDSTAPLPSSDDAVQEAFHRVVDDAESLLSTLDDDVQFSDAIRTSGSLAKIILSREAVETLRGELQDEAQKRIDAVRRYALSFPDGIASETEELPQLEGTPMRDGNGTPDLFLTPDGNARPEHQAAPAELPQLGDIPFPVSVVGVTEEPINDPFVVAAPVAPPIVEPTEWTAVQVEIHSLPSPSMQDSASTLVTLLVEDEPKVLQPHSPAVSMLDLQQDTHIEELSSTEEHKDLQQDALVMSTPDLQQVLPPRRDESSTTDEVQVHALPDNISPPPQANQDAPMLPEDDQPLFSTAVSSPAPATSHGALDSLSNFTSTLLSELVATRHRYDSLQHAFRDCSLTLKEFKRTFASSSPSPHNQTKLHRHLETVLARIDDYTEDARVELEIHVADEELTARGFETVLSVPGALANADERAEIEASAQSFLDGTDESVAQALDKFGKKLEDVQHDVAVVKRAVHELAMADGEGGDGEIADSDRDTAGARWTGWTAGLLGTNAMPTRSQTPVQTFGAVMTSPRLRQSAALGEASDGPLAALNLRIPMPASPLHAPMRYTHLGLGHPAEGPPHPRTISTMYSMVGLRSSSVGLGVGLGGSPSSARTRVQGVSGRVKGGLGLWGGESSPLRYGKGDRADTQVEEHDLGGVE